MAITEGFANRVANVAHSKSQLIDLMNELDVEKRSIRSYMTLWSSAPKEDGGLAGSKRSLKLRSMRDREGFLIEEREYVRQKLGELNGDQKALNRTVNKRSLEFSQAFMAAAERMLSEDLFLDIEAKASVMMLQEP